MILYDAHAHYAEADLQCQWARISDDLNEIDLKYAVVNGTSPADWAKVLELAQQDTRLLPAIGLHPWEVNDAPTNWQAQFLEALNQGARIIGEIGLDKWIEGYDLDAQQVAFRWQLAQATAHNLPVSIHCLKAIGPLMDTLRSEPLPESGIHLHAYNGPAELIPELVERGTYFSFNAGQLKAGKTKVAERIRAVPDERLLIETDAPDMLPPQELRTYELPESGDGKSVTHPATLINGYNAVAEIRAVSLETLTKQVANNFETYFLG